MLVTHQVKGGAVEPGVSGAPSVALAIDLGRWRAHREMPARILSVARARDSIPVISLILLADRFYKSLQCPANLIGRVFLQEV